MFEILGRFFNFCDKENRRKFHLAIAIGVVNSFFMALRIAAVAVMISGTIESLLDNVPFTPKTIWLSLGIMAFSLLGAIVTKKIMAMLQTEGGYRTAANKRIEIAEHLRYIPMGYFNKNSLGQITSVTTNTMELLGDVATRAVMLVMQGLLDSALIIVMIFFFDWRIALIALGGFAVFQFVNVFMRLSVKSLSVQKDKAETAQISKILEYIQGIAEVRAYNITGKRRTELNAIIDRCKGIFIKMELCCIPFACIQSIIAKGVGVVIMLASIFFYLNGTMLPANCVVMLICSFMLFGAMESGGNYSALLRVIDIAVKKAEAILNVPMMDIRGEVSPSLQTARLPVADKQSSATSSAGTPRNAPTLSAQNITFAYDRKKIIDGVSLTIPGKTTTAIVGPSGGGKTTLCHLLARFWDVDTGEVTLAGKNLRDYDMDSLMAHFSFVFQNVYLFHDTIANNIRFGEPDAPMEKVIAAAKKAACHEFISALPDGYDTVIGEGGASLSGGEKQRISIARAIMKDAPIIVLDEATANVDPENERDLMTAISELTREKTVIMIAHRLKTVRNADQIIVLDRGKIAEQGKHDDLVRNGGIYARFIDSRKKAVSWKL